MGGCRSTTARRRRQRRRVDRTRPRQFRRRTSGCASSDLILVYIEPISPRISQISVKLNSALRIPGRNWHLSSNRYGRISKALQCFGRINWKSRRSSVSTRVTFRRSPSRRSACLRNRAWHRSTAGESLRSASNLLDEESRELVRS